MDEIDVWDEVCPQASAILESLWEVDVVDPEWGRKDALWMALEGLQVG